MTGIETEIAIDVLLAREETITTDQDDTEENKQEIMAEKGQTGTDTIPLGEDVHEVQPDKIELEGPESHPHVQSRALDLQAILQHRLPKEESQKKS